MKALPLALTLALTSFSTAASALDIAAHCAALTQLARGREVTLNNVKVGDVLNLDGPLRHSSYASAALHNSRLAVVKSISTSGGSHVITVRPISDKSLQKIGPGLASLPLLPSTADGTLKIPKTEFASLAVKVVGQSTIENARYKLPTPEPKRIRTWHTKSGALVVFEDELHYVKHVHNKESRGTRWNDDDQHSSLVTLQKVKPDGTLEAAFSFMLGAHLFSDTRRHMQTMEEPRVWVGKTSLPTHFRVRVESAQQAPQLKPITPDLKLKQGYLVQDAETQQVYIVVSQKPVLSTSNHTLQLLPVRVMDLSIDTPLYIDPTMILTKYQQPLVTLPEWISQQALSPGSVLIGARVQIDSVQNFILARAHLEQEYQRYQQQRAIDEENSYSEAPHLVEFTEQKNPG